MLKKRSLDAALVCSSALDRKTTAFVEISSYVHAKASSSFTIKVFEKKLQKEVLKLTDENNVACFLLHRKQQKDVKV